MAVDVQQVEAPDVTPTAAVLETTLPETTETAEPATTEGSGDDEEREECREEAEDLTAAHTHLDTTEDLTEAHTHLDTTEDLTDAHTHLDTTERSLLPDVSSSSWTKLYVQCVDAHEECVDDLEQSVDDLEQSVDDLEQCVDDPAGQSSPTQEAESAPSGEKRNSLVSDMSPTAVSQVDALTRYQPAAAARAIKATLDPSHSAPLRRRAESAADSDNDISAPPEVVLRARAAPAGQEGQMLMDNERRRPNSGSFSISSARRRSKVVDRGEWIPNQEEVTRPVEPATRAPLEPTRAPLEPTRAPLEPARAPLEPTRAPLEPTRAPLEPARAPLNNKEIPEKQRGPLEERAREGAQRHPWAPEKRGSLRREVVPSAADARTEEDKTDERSREPDEVGCQRRAETAEEKRSAFGVTLRTTSLSLKYRSDTAQPDAKLKRHSLEASYMRAISEDLSGQHTGSLQSSRDTASSTARVDAPNRPFGLRKNPSLSSDSGPTDSPAEDLKRKDSASTTRLWDRGSRSSLSSTEGVATGAALQKTTSTPAPPKLPARPSTLPPAPAPSSRVVPGRPLGSLGTERSAVDRRCDRANTDDKRASLSRTTDGAACGDSQTKSNSKPAGGPDGSGSQSSSSSSPPLQQSARGQPSWMELAKRKSLAWNDPTDRRRSQL
ncbi:CRACD-like protein [Sardina pilchardus]|uniref:CRACD-like protein n=1 Tax=Sardina pilchardus TaxID=27697 RepID=UPI002E114ED3